MKYLHDSSNFCLVHSYTGHTYEVRLTCEVEQSSITCSFTGIKLLVLTIELRQMLLTIQYNTIEV